jgi:hypothetical protein
MILNSISRHRPTAILILTVFSVVIILFAGIHSMTGLAGNGSSHQSNPYSCLFTFCVAIFSVPTMLTLFIFTTLFFNFIPPPKPAPLFLLEKPPRGWILI